MESDSQIGHKRHPTLEDGVIVGSGAQVLGPISVRTGARVGANAVVVKDVQPGTTVVGIPAKVAERRTPDKPAEFLAYGTPTEDLPDPVAQAMAGLVDQIDWLRARVEELERQIEGRPAGFSSVPVPVEDQEPEGAGTAGPKN